MSDVVTNAHSSNTTEKNGSIVVGAPKGANTSATGTKYILTAGDTSDMTVKGTGAGVNDAADITGQITKYDGRFEHTRYYSGDATT